MLFSILGIWWNILVVFRKLSMSMLHKHKCTSHAYISMGHINENGITSISEVNLKKKKILHLFPKSLKYVKEIQVLKFRKD